MAIDLPVNSRVKSLTEEASGENQSLTFCRMIDLKRECRESWVLENRMWKRKPLQAVSKTN